MRAQFDQYYDVLEQNGVRVNYIEPPVPMISAYGYIKNLDTMAGGGLVVRGGAIIHRMGLGSWQRGREVIWSKALAALQVPIYLTIHGTGVGELGAGNKDWQPQRIGADPPIGAVDLTDQTSLRVLSACGIPSALVAIAPGTAAREAFRRFLHVTVAPLLNIVAAECREKLNVDDLTFDTTDLHAADVAGRARAFQSLVGGGMGLDQAAGLSGLLIGDD